MSPIPAGKSEPILVFLGKSDPRDPGNGSQGILDTSGSAGQAQGCRGLIPKIPAGKKLWENPGKASPLPGIPGINPSREKLEFLPHFQEFPG